MCMKSFKTTFLSLLIFIKAILFTVFKIDYFREAMSYFRTERINTINQISQRN